MVQYLCLVYVRPWVQGPVLWKITPAGKEANWNSQTADECLS